MKKVLRALSIGAMALQGAALLVFLLTVAGQREIRLFAAPRGATYLAAYSTLQALTGIANSISGLASSLALVACGMSIAEKKLAPRA